MTSDPPDRPTSELGSDAPDSQSLARQSTQVSDPPPAPARYVVENHLEKILRGIGPLEAYDQPLIESLGLPLVEDITATTDLPRFDNSAMDGYAVRSADLIGATPHSPVTLPVVGSVAAGSARPFAMSAGAAVKIMTGAPIPTGADTIVPLEATDGGAQRVAISQEIPTGRYIRRAAEDVRAGEVVLAAGTVLGPREVGLLASLGIARIKARPRPRVVIMSTGAELREPGSSLDFDSIFDGNSYMLAAAVRAAGAIAYRVHATSDNPRDFINSLNDQLVRADLVITSGGISKGDHDVVKAALAATGEVEFVEVAMQPGKPQGFGVVGEDRTPIITLPGNTVSAYVSFEVFVLPAIRRMMGLVPYRRPMVHAVLAADITSSPGKRQYVRGFFEVTHRGAKVTPMAAKGSHLVGGLAQANALIVVGEDETALHMGETVRTLVLDRPF